MDSLPLDSTSPLLKHNLSREIANDVAERPRRVERPRLGVYSATSQRKCTILPLLSTDRYTHAHTYTKVTV